MTVLYRAVHVLYCTIVLYSTVHYYIILLSIVLYFTITYFMISTVHWDKVLYCILGLRCFVSYSIVMSLIILHYVVLFLILPYYILLWSSVLYCEVRRYIVQYCANCEVPCNVQALYCIVVFYAIHVSTVIYSTCQDTEQECFVGCSFQHRSAILYCKVL